MTREEFLQTVQEENLLVCGYLKKEPGKTESENTYGWMFLKGRWYPYKTDERAVMTVFGEYSSESEALEKLLSKMRKEKAITWKEQKGEHND